MTLPVVKCILCFLLMFTYIAPRVKVNYILILFMNSFMRDYVNLIFSLSDLSTKLWVKYSNITFETHLVPISELFSLESTLTLTQVPSATFSLNHSCARFRCCRFLFTCFDSDAYTQAWLSFSIFVGSWVHPMAFKIPRFEMTSPFKVWLTALISDSAVDVDTLPWSVEHQHTTVFPKYPLHDVWEWPLFRLPPRSASHWNLSCRGWVIVLMSVGPFSESKPIMNKNLDVTQRIETWNNEQHNCIYSNYKLVS